MGPIVSSGIIHITFQPIVFELAFFVVAVEQGNMLPGDVTVLEVEPSFRERELEWIKWEASLQVAPIVVLESCVAKCAPSGIAASEKLRELNILVFLDLGVANIVLVYVYLLVNEEF